MVQLVAGLKAEEEEGWVVQGGHSVVNLEVALPASYMW